MREFLVCDMCTAIVSTDMSDCEYCGNDFKSNGTSAEILNYKLIIQKKYAKNNIDEILNEIAINKYSEHPIIKFEYIKLTLFKYLCEYEQLIWYDLNKLLLEILELSKISEDYISEFINIFKALISNSNANVSLEQYSKIKVGLIANFGNTFDIIIEDIANQAIISLSGKQFIKEYLFFSNKSNFINDVNFIKKKNKLINEHNKLKEIINKI